MSDLFDSIVDSSTYVGPSGGSPGPQMDYGVLDEDMRERDSWNRLRRGLWDAQQDNTDAGRAKKYYDWLKANYPNAYKQANETYGGGDGKISDKFEADQMMKGHSEFYGSDIFSKGGFAEENIYESMPENLSRLQNTRENPDGTFTRREEFQTDDINNFSEFAYSPGAIIRNPDLSLRPIDHEEYTKEYNETAPMRHADWTRERLEATGQLLGSDYMLALEQLAPNMTAEGYPEWMQDVNSQLESYGFTIPSQQTHTFTPKPWFNPLKGTFHKQPERTEEEFGYDFSEGQKIIPGKGKWPENYEYINLPEFKNTELRQLERTLDRADRFDNIKPRYPPLRDIEHIRNPVFFGEKQK